MYLPVLQFTKLSTTYIQIWEFLQTGGHYNITITISTWRSFLFINSNLKNSCALHAHLYVKMCLSYRMIDAHLSHNFTQFYTCTVRISHVYVKFSLQRLQLKREKRSCHDFTVTSFGGCNLRRMIFYTSYESDILQVVFEITYGWVCCHMSYSALIIVTRCKAVQINLPCKHSIVGQNISTVTRSMVNNYFHFYVN